MSQLLALRTLTELNATTSLDWDQLCGLRHVPKDDEERACHMIGECIHAFLADEHGKQVLVQHLRDRLAAPVLESLERRQARFRESMPERGTPEVARRVLEVLDSSSVSRRR
jgi:hypothetical protein